MSRLSLCPSIQGKCYSPEKPLDIKLALQAVMSKMELQVLDMVCQ